MGGDGSATTGTTLTVDAVGGITLADNSVIRLTLGAAGAHTSIDFTGSTVTFDSNQLFTFNNVQQGTYNNILVGTGDVSGIVGGWLISNSGFSGTFTYDGANVDLTVVPEPSTWALVALGLTSMVILRRRVRA